MRGIFHETKLSVKFGLDKPIFKQFQKNSNNINKNNLSMWQKNYVHEKLGDIPYNILVFAENKIKEDLNTLNSIVLPVWCHII